VLNARDSMCSTNAGMGCTSRLPTPSKRPFNIPRGLLVCCGVGVDRTGEGIRVGGETAPFAHHHLPSSLADSSSATFALALLAPHGHSLH
jgi:hypothetical protein